VKKDIDLDTRPKSYTWIAREFSDLHPRLYHVSACSNCLWASTSHFFETMGEGSTVLPKNLATEINGKKDKKPHADVVAILREGLVFEKDSHFTYTQAVKLHLLALYNQFLLVNIKEREPFHVARYSLRLAWLFRDIFEDKQGEDSTREEVEQLIQTLKAHWSDVPETEFQFTELALEYYKAALLKSGLLSTEREEVECILLITQVLMQAGRVKEAREHLRLGKSKTIAFDQKTRNDQYQARVAKNEAHEEEIIKQKAEVRRIKLSLDRVQIVFEKVVSDWEDAQRKKAELLVDQHSHLSTDGLRELLKRHDIESRIVNQLDAIKEKKKGFLSSLLQ